MTQKLNSSEVLNIYKKCLKLVKRKPPGFIIFKKLRYHGWCKEEEDILEIDHRKDMLRTAYHECIHYLYPDWSETQVLYAESKVVNNSTLKQNVKFLKCLIDSVYQSLFNSKGKHASRN